MSGRGQGGTRLNMSGREQGTGYQQVRKRIRRTRLSKCQDKNRRSFQLVRKRTRGTVLSTCQEEDRGRGLSKCQEEDKKRHVACQEENKEGRGYLHFLNREGGQVYCIMLTCGRGAGISHGRRVHIGREEK